MKALDKNTFDLAIVDPPYGIGADKGIICGESGFKKKGKAIQRRKYTGDWDKQRPTKEYFLELLRVSKNQIIWGGNFFADLLPQGTHWVFWDKLQTMPSFSDGELAWTSFNRKSIKKHTLEYNGLIGREKTRIHPTQKPVKLYEWLLINYANPNMNILDTHLGSGSSAIASHYFGCNFVGCELDSGFYSLATERFTNETKQSVLF